MSKKDVFAPSRRCISMDTLSLPEKFWQSFRVKEKKPHKLESQESVGYWRRYGWSRRNGWNQKRGDRLICRINLDLENENDIGLFADRGVRLVCRLIPGFWKWKGFRLVCRIDLDSEIANQPNEKETMCLPQKTASLQSTSCLISQGSFDRFYRMIEQRRWWSTRLPNTSSEQWAFCSLTVDGGVDLLFCIFLVLKNA